MENLFAMRRANGDWFALDDRGSLRMPVFRSKRDAVIAGLRHKEMECFRAARFDDRALQELRSSGNENGFWIVNDPTINLKKAVKIDIEQLVTLVQKRSIADKTGAAGNE